MKKQKGNALLGLIIIVLVIAGGIGWVKNLYALFHLTGKEALGEILMRVFGIFPLIGAFVGYI